METILGTISGLLAFLGTLVTAISLMEPAKRAKMKRNTADVPISFWFFLKVPAKRE